MDVLIEKKKEELREAEALSAKIRGRLNPRERQHEQDLR